MEQRQQIIECLTLLDKLINESHPTTSTKANKELRELHDSVSAKLRKKYPYSPMDLTFESF